MTTRRELARQSWGRFVEYVPEMSRRGFASAWLGAVVGSGLLLVVAGAWLARRWPYGGVLAQAGFVGWTGAWAYLGFWRHREAYLRRYGDDAYRALFLRYVGPALAGLFAASWMPLAAVSGDKLPPALRLLGSAYLFTTAGLITARGRSLFWNIDLRAFVYSVYPDRGEWVSSPLFDRVRHPIYSAAVRWVLGMALARGNAESVACGLILASGFRLWCLAEEADLVGRYPSYAGYLRTVPALFVATPGRYADFLRYLLAGEPVEKFARG